MMSLREFAGFHLPALETDEIRFGLPIAIITAAAKELQPGFCFWTVGPAGHCAVKSPGRGILLGDLDRGECEELARTTRDLDYPGVAGAGETAIWFARHAAKLGVNFGEGHAQRIHVLTKPPHYPAGDGSPRIATTTDAPLLFEWMMAFHDEAVPHDPPPERSNIEQLAASGRCVLWMRGGRPVSFAALIRSLKRSAAIAPVYTPPEYRGKGYGGSATAAVADRIFAEGKTMVSLYTNLRNESAIRCYARIGFEPYCDAWYFLRAR